MDEVDEVAQAIYQQHPEFFPLTQRHNAVCLAAAQLGEGESQQLIDNLADALMEIKPCK